MKCNCCGFVQNEYSVYCEKCGTYLKNDQAFASFGTQNGQPNYDRPTNEYPNNNSTQNQNNGMSYGSPAQNVSSQTNSVSPKHPPFVNYNEPTQLITPTYQYYSPPSDYSNASKSNGNAVTSMILGILSLVTFPIGLILAIIGLPLGLSSNNDLRNQNLPRGIAIAGITLNIAGMVISAMVIFLVFYIFYPILSYFTGLFVY